MSNINFNNIIVSALNYIHINTVLHWLVSLIGFSFVKEVTLNANNTTQSINIYQFTGTIEWHSFKAFLTDVTVFNNCTNFRIYIDRGGSKTYLTTGIDISGIGLNSYIVKAYRNGQDLVFTNATNGGEIEPTGDFSDVAIKQHITAKNGVNNYIGIEYTTTDTPINAKIKSIVKASRANGAETGNIEVL